MMTSTVLRGLERRGLVTRVADPDDARVLRVAVTASGLHVVERGVVVVEAAHARFFGAVEESDRVLRVLRAPAGEPTAGGA